MLLFSSLKCYDYTIYSFVQCKMRSKAHHEKVFINCQYSMATFSAAERKRRPRGDLKSKEMTQHLKQTFEAAIQTHLYPRSQIDIYVEVSPKLNMAFLLQLSVYYKNLRFYTALKLELITLWLILLSHVTGSPSRRRNALRQCQCRHSCFSGCRNSHERLRVFLLIQLHR